METLVTSADGKVDVVEHLHNGGSGSGSETNDVVMSGVGGAGVGGIMGVPMFQTMDASFVPRIKRLMNQLNSAGVHAGLFLLNGDRPQVFASSNDMVRMFKSEEFNMVSQRHFGHLECMFVPATCLLTRALPCSAVIARTQGTRFVRPPEGGQPQAQ